MQKTQHHERSVQYHRSSPHFTPNQILDGIAVGYPIISDFTFQFEGGYVDDPDDPGGCTNMGITIDTLRAWRNDSATNCDDVKNLTKVEAQMIYALNYWEPIWGNRLPMGLSCQVYDWGVNSGPRRAVEHMQRLAGTSDDGIMGPNTLAAVETWVDKAGIEAALRSYHADRQAYYESLSTFGKYGKGWTSRNDACLDLSLQLAEHGPYCIPAPPTLPPVSGDLEARVAALEAWAGSFTS